MQRRMTCQIPTDAMEPTIPKDSVVVIDTAYYYSNEPQRWDVVAFTGPSLERMQFDLGRRRVDDGPAKDVINAAADISEEREAAVRPHLFFVKRIVGLPGERIQFTETAILCNGKELYVPRDIQHCYSRFNGISGYAFGAEEYVTPDYNVFMLSDNLDKGKDSRQLGAISLHNLIGRVTL